MNRRVPLLLVAALAAAVIGAGCGDDDEETTTTTTTTTDEAASVELTLDQWTAQADRICGQADRALEQAAQQEFGQQPPSEAELEEFGRTVLAPNLQSQHDAIEALPAPAAETDQVEAMLSGLQEGIDQIEEDPSLLVQGADSVPAIAEATEIAQELGLTDCGSG